LYKNHCFFTHKTPKKLTLARKCVNLYSPKENIAANPAKTGGAKLKGLTAESAYGSQLQTHHAFIGILAAIWLYAQIVFLF
jgi:hypothetical protein